MNEPENKWEKLDWLKPDGPVLPLHSAPPPVLHGATYTMEYKPRGWALWGIPLCAFGAWYMASHAQHNDRGLIINGIIRLGPAGATAVYWALAAICVVGLVMFSFYIIPMMLFPRRITLEKDAITLPGRGYSRTHYRLPADEIESVSIREYGKMTYIRLRHRGRTFVINSAWLPSEADVPPVVDWFAARFKLTGA